MGKLADKVAIITAAGGTGMGRAAARLFAREGAQVIVADVVPEGGQETAKLIRVSGGEATFVEADVSKVVDMERMVKVAIDTYGRLNILFNHAGTRGPFELEGVSEQEWDECVDVNTKGAFFASQFAVPAMRKAGGGSIIFTGSVHGLVGGPIDPTYSFTKGGIVNLTRALAVLLAPDSIRVNCICPGIIGGATDVMTPPDGSPEDPDQQRAINEIRKPLLAKTPMGRPGEPEEVAQAALFLASDDASFITGVNLPVDGGLIAAV
jgi:NAD(P)-dependent dehydrogenase (short-subunit alcohol dehydrogenase family)